MRRSITKIICCTLILACFFVPALFSFSNSENTYAYDSPTPVKVGFFALDGYHNINENGQKSGYGYELLQMIGGYANFEYTYVGYDKNWKELVEMLFNGEIDFITYGYDDYYLEKYFDCSDHSVGTTSAVLLANPDSKNMIKHDFKLFDGIKIGILNNSPDELILIDYAHRNNINYTPMYFEDNEKALTAMDKERVDVILSNPFVNLSDVVVVDILDSVPLRVLFNKDTPELKARVDEAIARLNSASANWILDLMDKEVRSGGKQTESPLTHNEDVYLQMLKDSGTKIKVLVREDRYPYTYFEDGEPKGVIVDILKKELDKYELPYEFLSENVASNYDEIIKKQDADIVLDFSGDSYKAETLGYRLTCDYLTTYFSAVSRTDESKKTGKVGVTDTMVLRFGKNFENFETVRFDSTEECIRAVKDGKVDMTFCYSLTAQMYMLDDTKNELRESTVNSLSSSFKIAVNKNFNMELYSVLDRIARGVDGMITEEMYHKYMLKNKHSYNLEEFVKNNPLPIIIILSATLVTAIIVTYIEILRKRKLQKAYVEAESANKAKTNFLSSMSHDIRTPMNAILGMSEIGLKNVANKDKAKDSFEKIKLSGTFLLSLINDILDISAIENGKMILRESEVDLKTCFDTIERTLKQQIENKSQNGYFHIHDIICPRVKMDELRFDQIFINLVGNAFKYTPQYGTIVFELYQKESDGVVYTVGRVSDTGIGMTKEFMEDMWDSFRRATDTRINKVQGSGLGLSIVREIVKKMNGTIEVESEVEKGTTFIVTLPLKPAEKTQEEREESIDEGKNETDIKDMNLTVLVAEDNDINWEILEELLKNYGVKAVRAEDGVKCVEAFKAAEAGTYALIFMDIQMPNMNGIEATKVIRELSHPEAKTIPIVAVTANVFLDDVQACRNAGMNDHLSKPIDPEKLIGVILKYGCNS